MGWRSYCIYFNNDVELGKVLNVMKEHNNTFNLESVGEELESFGTGRYNNRNVFLCGNWGGSISTVQFFRRQGLTVLFYDDISKEVTDKTPRENWDTELKSKRVLIL